MNQALRDELEAALKKEIETVRAELERFASPDKENKDNWNAKYPDPDRDHETPEEGAGEAEEYDNRISLEHNLELRLRDLELALDKMKTGRYGICERCGKEIEEKRLRVCPEARECMACQKTGG
ncbi:MAG: TraR/DksA family transcriptional regulator [Candidatus Saccharimonadales bacterium]